MAGMFGKLRELLSTEVRIKPPEGAQRVCNNCSFWLAPAGLTVTLTKSQRALDWARQGGYGCCQAPRAKISDDEGQRFTLPQAKCKQWTWHGKEWAPLPPTDAKTAKAGLRRN